MKLYGYTRSSAAYRCRIAFSLKGITPEFISIDLPKGEQKAAAFLDLNPQALVPTLDVNGQILTQSLAIIEWLDETYPDPPLLPSDPLDKAHVRAIALSIACDIHPFQNLRVLKDVKTRYSQDQAGLDAWSRRWIEPGFAALETTIAHSGKAGAFCFGDTPTLADICLVPQMLSATRFKVEMSQFPTLMRIAGSCQAHPAILAAHPDRQA